MPIEAKKHISLILLSLIIFTIGSWKYWPSILKNSSGIISAEIPIGDLVDKITILQIKQKKIKDPQKLAHVLTELESLKNTYNNAVQKTEPLEKLQSNLQAVNERLWDIEDLLRKKELDQDFDQDFLHLARSVYFTNDERCSIKRKINELLSSHLVEQKELVNYHKEGANYFCVNEIDYRLWVRDIIVKA